YIVEQLPGIKGIVLRNVAFEKRIHTQLEVEMLSRFIARVREKLGKKNNSKLKLIVEVEPLIGNDCGNLFGQRYTDFSKYADVLLLKTFDENLMPFYQDKTKTSIENALIACTPDNSCTLQVQVSSSANANSVSVLDQLNIAMKHHAAGFTIFDYQSTSQSEWSSIDKFTPQN
ncbi:MAG: hypothetical protein KAR20_08310, partial [Candidatus Heimdallarchaeota archaeon]|nr:hypothetical protein [Candidatus Heimdallarchaeota archaeon]